MLKYARLEVNDEEYNRILKIQTEVNRQNINEQSIGSRRKLFVQGNLIATTSMSNAVDIGDLTQHQFNAFLGGFSKQLYRQFDKNDSLYSLNHSFTDVAREKFDDVFNSLNVNEYFYNIDLRSAYWQIAYKLGYLNENYFTRYFPLDEYKHAKRLCISFLARPNKMNYVNEQGSYTIHCDMSVLKKVYENIRAYLYQIIFECVQLCSEVIEYNIDGVSVKKENVEVVQDYFKQMQFKYKITECRKLNEYQYQYGNKTRNFKLKNR